MDNLFEKSFKNGGSLLTDIVRKSNDASMSDFIGSDIGMIINTIKLFNYPLSSTRGKEMRELFISMYSCDITKLLIEAKLRGEKDILQVIHDQASLKRNIIVSRLSNLKLDCYPNKNKLALIILVLGILSSIPNKDSDHKYNYYFYKKLKLHKTGILTCHRTLNRRYILIRSLLKDVASLTYDDAICNPTLFDSVISTIIVLLIIYILSNDNTLKTNVSKILHVDDIKLSLIKTLI